MGEGGLPPPVLPPSSSIAPTQPPSYPSMPESSSIPGNPSQSSATSVGQSLSLPNAFAVPSLLIGSQASEAPLVHVKSGNGEPRPQITLLFSLPHL
ncbi:hypothetical protein QJS10_CPB20g00590 [Acorus calamus]|uniref:Uncharacterized protein n=1 Tax=Acorus calamus TaxID=4465 RepID=A0AAV9C917_ACOCL|nr:hypothetical protein QJS10_CPB20g00590 [Acorus calamus]